MTKYRGMRFRPSDPDASHTTCLTSHARIERTFCAKKICGRVAWKLLGEPNGRLCEACFDEECDDLGVRRLPEPGVPRTANLKTAW